MVAVKIASEQSLSFRPRVSLVNPLMLSPGIGELAHLLCCRSGVGDGMFDALALHKKPDLT
jgi:hypothetical protein